VKNLAFCCGLQRYEIVKRIDFIADLRGKQFEQVARDETEGAVVG